MIAQVLADKEHSFATYRNKLVQVRKTTILHSLVGATGFVPSSPTTPWITIATAKEKNKIHQPTALLWQRQKISQISKWWHHYIWYNKSWRFSNKKSQCNYFLPLYKLLKFSWSALIKWRFILCTRTIHKTATDKPLNNKCSYSWISTKCRRFTYSVVMDIESSVKAPLETLWFSDSLTDWRGADW